MQIFLPSKPKFLLSVLDGSSLERRVMHLIEDKLLWATRWRAVSALGCAAAMGVVCFGAISLAVGTSAAQVSENKLPAFEVATIKPSKGDCCGFMISAEKTLLLRYSVRDLVKQAYGFDNLSGDRVYGGPAWVTSTHFDVEAKTPEPLPAEWMKIPAGERNREMIQTLLAERFRLKVHHETRDLPIYVLTLAKNGPKLKPTTHALTEADLKEPPANGMVRSMSQNWGGTRKLGQGNIVAQREDMNVFTKYFLQFLPELGGRTVIDKTGLTGAYDFSLQYLPQEQNTAAGNTGLTPPDDSQSSLFTALQEQLGLKLEATRGPVDVIVIDSVEKPTEN